MLVMFTIDEIRHANLLLLLDGKRGALQELATTLGKSHAQLSQLKNRNKYSKSGQPRSIGDQLAREIEIALDRERGWMDHEHPTHAASASEPVTPTDDEEDLILAFRDLPMSERKVLLADLMAKAEHWRKITAEILGRQGAKGVVTSERAAATLPKRPDGDQPLTAPPGMLSLPVIDQARINASQAH